MSLHTETISLAPVDVLWTVSQQIAVLEKILPRHYTISLSQFRSASCSSLHYYRERIRLIPSPFSGGEPHTYIHILTSPTHPSPLIEI